MPRSAAFELFSVLTNFKAINFSKHFLLIFIWDERSVVTTVIKICICDFNRSQLNGNRFDIVSRS